MSCCDSKPATPSSVGGTCAPGALNGGLVRTKFFDGMILTQADLENEQRYWRLKRRLTNRALGQGVVWGLRARWDNLRNVIALGPGYALDCCGNDLVVECATEQSLADLWNRADPLIKARDPASFSRASSFVNNAPRLTTACLVLQYVECPQDARPVQTDACTPPSSRCESSRIRETTRLALVPPPPAAPPTCIDDLFEDLEQIKLSITDVELRNQIFPPPPAATTTPATDATLPLTLTVRTPGFSTGSTPSAATITPLANGTTNGPPVIVATRVPTGISAGLVQFEMRPVADWGFYQGQVKDGDAVVDMVAPPLDLQQFWALEIALSDNVPSATKSFSYVVDALGLEQMFGARAKGLASLTISGRVTATRSQAAAGVETRVEGLTVVAQSTVGEASATGSCFDVLRWGFMADPAHGADDVKTLLLAAIYAYFADLSARSGGAWTQQRYIAMLLYIVAWRLLNVNILAANEELRQELGRVLARLFECWCNAMLYPGPRCATDDHGVVLGTATFTLSGQLVSFDMWENRREVITGPLINHWLGVFGFAPIDVVANRIAQAICCISGLQIPTIGFGQDGTTGGVILGPNTNANPDRVAVPLGGGNVVVGRATNAAATDVSPTSLVGHMVSALVGANGTPLATFRSRLANGTVVEVTAPSTSGDATTTGSITTSVDPIVRALAPALSPINRSVVARATSELAREVPASAVAELSAPASELAKSLGAMTVAGLVEAGPEGLLAKAPSADPAAVDELLAKADTTLGQLAESAAAATRKTKVGKPSAMLREPALRKALTADLTKKFDLAKTAVDRALERAASQGA